MFQKISTQLSSLRANELRALNEILSLMRFILDENVADAARLMLEEKGYCAASIRDFVVPGTVDAVVAHVAEQQCAILVSHDGDFRKIAPRVHDGQRKRFRQLERKAFMLSQISLSLACSSPAKSDNRVMQSKRLLLYLPIKRHF